MTVSFEGQPSLPATARAGARSGSVPAGPSRSHPGEIAANNSLLAGGLATPRERRFAWGIVVGALLIFVAAAPYAGFPLVKVPAFALFYEVVLLVVSAISAIVLIGRFLRGLWPPMLALAAGYLFDALIVLVQILSVPGMVTPAGVIGGGALTAVWLGIFWLGGFPVFVAAYAALRRLEEGRVGAAASRQLAIGATAFVVMVVAAMTLVSSAGPAHLPSLVANGAKSPAAMVIVVALLALNVAALVALLWAGIRSSLDLWMSVIMVGWVVSVAIGVVLNSGPYDVGFYLSRFFGLGAASLILGLALLDASGLRRRLATAAARLNAEVRDGAMRQQRTEEQLRQAQKMEAIGNLTGGMAHDFNNLLAIVIGNLDMLVSQRKQDSDVQQLGGEALDAALRGADLTQRLLAFARRQPLQAKRVELNPIITNIVRLLSRTLGETIEITLDLDKDLWPVVIDPAQLDASLTNLATNARDAMPNGGSLIVVTGNRHLDADYAAQHADLKPGDYALIEVSDTGTGMDPEVAARIFEPFFTTKDQGKGTGLGLSMVYGFMKQSGGHINVYSERGIGTTFRLYLPRADVQLVTADKPTLAAVIRGKGQTVLAVEDNASLRRVVARQLRELGYRVLEAENPARALTMLEEAHVDLLFSDVVMPGGMSGIELARTACERWPATKVLLTSGFPDAKFNGNDKQGAPAMRWPLLNKPYRKEDLARAIGEALAPGD